MKEFVNGRWYQRTDYCDIHECFSWESEHCECWLEAESAHDDSVNEYWEERVRGA